jgi:ATP-binding cassette subfamily B protein RaxB
MLAVHLGIATDLAMLRRQIRISLKGATLTQIIRVGQALGLSTRAVTCSVEELAQLRTPCILHWRFNHFVVLAGVTPNGLNLYDPARGVVFESFETVRKAFTGVALEVSVAAPPQRSRPPLQLKLGGLIAPDGDTLRKFGAGLALAFICEALLLVTPFYLQTVIDQVLGKGDVSMLNTLVVAFGLLLLLQVAANTMRQLTFQFLSHVTVFDITARVVRKLLQLPIRYFRDRELGDIQHRIQAMARVQQFVVQALPGLMLDSIFIVLIVAMMSIYDARLTLMMLATLAIWCLWRALILPYGLRLANDTAQAEATVQTHLLESLRVMQSIKSVNGEQQRESQWRNLFANAVNARIRAGNLSIADALLRQLLFQGARILAIYQLARNGLQGAISVGMISAYVAYLGMFTTRAMGIVDRVLEYKFLAVPLERLADIVFSESELRVDDVRECGLGDVTLDTVSFAYTQGESAILENCSAVLRADDFTVIAGASGSGKSTLLQLIAGNEQALTGVITLGTDPVQRWSRRNLRSQIAVVFQGDALLKGSVADNIALFEHEVDMDRVRQAAIDCCIANEIESFPMAYETRVGDLGSALSRGQVQRILLARAFYREPRLLLLDEVTSGLDPALERRVIAAISRHPASKIVVAHSDLMLQAATRILWLHKGELLSSRPNLNV